MSMISHIYKLITEKSKHSQDGVSLMLSILVLAAITAISFSLATIVFIELRSSGDVVRSEPSLYATLGITEEALFQYKRFVNEREDGSTVQPPLLDVVGCEPAKSVCQLGGVSFDANNDIQLLDEDINPRLQTIYAGEDITIPLYGAADNFDAQYGRVVLQIVPADHDYSLGVSLRSIREDGYVPPPQTWTLSEGVVMERSEMSLPGYQHDLILSNNSSENFLVEIRSYDTNGSTPKGLPFIGRKVLKVVANYLGITRNYWVNIPTGSAGGAPDESTTDIVWVGDSLPSGSSPVSDPDPWNWVSSNPTPFSGTSAHKSGVYSGIHQHYFTGASSPLAVGSGDVMVTYVYIDPANIPRQLMIQFNNGIWDHRAYWGENTDSLIPWGVNGTASRYWMGAMPPAGQWVRLEVPASVVGLEGSSVNGMAFTLYDGQVTWDHSGKEQ